ncbi:hypothetical protein [uncultured Limosilactobacillus sp.]|uniref:hypothetical protein n=1 Tax=uncultured Limosilactobacillus sp. TaxID=2837629 RepID=UPI0025F64D9F|nr:hypothetical protein [uncultured Limosilactobacillus sp.]
MVKKILTKFYHSKAFIWVSALLMLVIETGSGFLIFEKLHLWMLLVILLTLLLAIHLIALVIQMVLSVFK